MESRRRDIVTAARARCARPASTRRAQQEQAQPAPSSRAPARHVPRARSVRLDPREKQRRRARTARWACTVRRRANASAWIARWGIFKARKEGACAAGAHKDSPRWRVRVEANLCSKPARPVRPAGTSRDAKASNLLPVVFHVPGGNLAFRSPVHRRRRLLAPANARMDILASYGAAIPTTRPAGAARSDFTQNVTQMLIRRVAPWSWYRVRAAPIIGTARRERIRSVPPSIVLNARTILSRVHPESAR